ncbi:MAG: YkgJ family cysteine cluster protein [Bdellovibrionales bacterium]|nr:YkgJ family cysteine cluster protein [Bdellovibrionales bacterium]
MKDSKTKAFYEKGLQFKCQGSGKCCVSRGEYGFVYMTKKDISKMAKLLKMNQKSFSSQYLDRTSETPHLIQPQDTEDCIFLKDNRCSVYLARPTQCRTWPFWPENMNSRAWKRDVVAFCPGASVRGKDALVPGKEIEKQLREQMTSEAELFGEN